MEMDAIMLVLPNKTGFISRLSEILNARLGIVA
jgi:hypothetical protein